MKHKKGSDKKEEIPESAVFLHALQDITLDKERPSRANDNDASNWSVAWADLMMTMFIMFAMMFIYMKSERNVTEAFQQTGPPGQHEGEGTNLSSGAFSEHRTFSPSGRSVDASPHSAPSGKAGVSLDADALLKSAPFPDAKKGAGLPPEEILKLAEEAVNETDLENIQVFLQDDETVKISLRGPLLFDLGSAKLRDQTKSFLDKVAFILDKIENEVHVVGHTDTFPIYTPAFPTNWELSSARASAVARYIIRAGDLDPGRFTVMGHSMYRPVFPNSNLENKQLNRRVEILITKKIYTPNPFMEDYGSG